MLLRKVYRFKLRPNQGKSKKLMQMAGAKRFVFNWALAKRRDYYEANQKSLSSKELSNALTALKHEDESNWLKGCDSQMLQQALKDVDRAFQNFFEGRTKFPRFKSKKDNIQAFRIPQRVKVEDGKVYIPKVGRVKIFQSQAIDCKTKSATFKRDTLGNWFVTLTAEFEMPDVPLPKAQPSETVGIDLGLKDFAVLSDGHRESSPKFYRNTERRLAKAQRSLSRKKKGSKNREKAKLRVAKLHTKVKNQRKDFLHKLSTQLVKTHQALCIEDLSLKGLVRTKLAKSFNDAALGEFRRQLEYKAIWHRKHLAVIDRFFPSSKLCGDCGTVNSELTLSDRVWTCCCGATHDRDLNAARNIKLEGLKQLAAAGLTEALNACGETVRPTRRHVLMKQESHCL